jgi:hypothetical protein
LAIFAFLILASQTVLHAYVLWLEPRTSVLDKYDQPLKDQIAAAASLDELVQRYDQVRKKADAAKQELARTGKELTFRDETQTEPYKSEHMLREAVTAWEEKAKEIHALRFYWLVGLVFAVLGLVTYKKFNRWFGVTLLLAGFSEIIYWTSPTFLGTNTREFDRLLINKFVLSIVSMALLIAVIWMQGIFADNQQRPAA